MEIKTDLKRILWHEIGHFCVDLLDCKFNSNFYIDGFWVSYHKNAISDQKWGGGVKTLPSIKWEVLVEDVDKTSFAMLGLISGCIFQTVFLKEFLKNSTSFNECFCFQEKCAGKGDTHSFHIIASKLRSKYGRKDEFIKFSEIELFDIYYKLIVENYYFLNCINELVINFSEKIYYAYQQSDSSNEFHYSFDESELEFLKFEADRIMKESSFIDEVINLKEKIKDKMIA